MSEKTQKQIVTFTGADAGNWEIVSIETIVGAPIPPFQKLAILGASETYEAVEPPFTTKAAISNLRYTIKSEKIPLAEHSLPLGRTEATAAALIPIKKSEEWWQLAQDERRQIFAEQSKHIEFSLDYLPFISRQLYHCRDLGEKFDFLTWFEFAPQHADKFDELVRFLRGTEEWKYVEREVDIRLNRSSAR